jgi:hypothetical protein
MRAPRRKRPMRRAVVAPPEGVDLRSLATRVRYVGSSEHKSFPSFAGPPKLRSDASRCDPELTDPSELTDWLRSGLTAGRVGAPWQGDFPRYVWYRHGDVCYEGRLTNQGAGEYKGYPLSETECPEGV